MCNSACGGVVVWRFSLLVLLDKKITRGGWGVVDSAGGKEMLCIDTVVTGRQSGAGRT